MTFESLCITQILYMSYSCCLSSSVNVMDGNIRVSFIKANCNNYNYNHYGHDESTESRITIF